MTDKTLSILLAGHDTISTRLVEEGLSTGGIRVATVNDLSELSDRVSAQAPDAVVATLGTPDRATLETLFRLARSGRCAVVLFADRADRGAIADAAEAGVAAFVVDGLCRDRVRVIVETAVKRFAAFETLKPAGMPHLCQPARSGTLDASRTAEQ
ncbi:ANTAR domain-containing response regulator [Azospirillum soli]|uniref:ANTAR domain-containing response regulator n=1 Tax=Azospirillum soli TaxID=1304799 RepID=UPI001AE3C257|nr:hypothetical protein [Azospirillum soli]MBP2316414.1 AmiR/NasT family two-component response regulator [Azospirillum soli]